MSLADARSARENHMVEKYNSRLSKLKGYFIKMGVAWFLDTHRKIVLIWMH